MNDLLQQLQARLGPNAKAIRALMAPLLIVMILAMTPLVFLASTVILTEGIELASSLWRVERRAVRASISEASERVCIHVPCYNEPPAMVIETLDALARLDYDNFEVIVLDNNTPDPETWKPVEAHCAALGPRFRFYHFDGVQGFKAGAKQATGDSAIPGAVAACDDDKTEGGQRDCREYKWRHVLTFLHGPAFTTGLGCRFSETRGLVAIAKTRCQSVMHHGAGIEATDIVGMTIGAVSDVTERNNGQQQMIMRGWLEM